jgi:ubiquinone biosynthesis protein
MHGLSEGVAIGIDHAGGGGKSRPTVPPELIPTPIIKHKERPPIVVADEHAVPRFPLLRMIRKFGGHLVNNLRLRLIAQYDEDAAAVRLREVFEELGGLWIKVGQLIAMRNDVFSDAVCRELSRLHSRAVGFPFEKVRESIRQDLGAEIEDIFEDFEEAPFAAASISQVHFATLPNRSARVCVKVLRPDAAHSFMRDLGAIKRLVGIFGTLGIGRHLHLDEALYELDLMVREELDFRYEASNMRRMRKTLRQHSIYVPRVFLDHSGRNTLVTEYVDGVLMTDFIETDRRDPSAQARWCAINEVNPEKVAKTLFYSSMRQLFEDNLFHADIHPGNILLLRENKVALIDFGTIGRSGRGFLATYRQSLSALAEQDFAKAADITMQLTITPPSIDRIKQLRTDLIRLYREWDGRSHLAGVGYHERSMAAAGSASGKVMTRHNVQLSWDFMRISRTWATLDASIGHLYPDADYMSLFRGYFKRSSRRSRQIKNVIPRTARLVNNVSKSVSEYENLLGPALRRRLIYTSAAGQMSERFALSLIAFLKLIKWTVYILLIGGALALFDRHYSEIVWLEQHLIRDFFDFVHQFGFFDLAIGLTFIVIIVYHVGQAIAKLNPKN